MDSFRLLFPLLLLGLFASALRPHGANTDPTFDCINDFDENMFCQFEQQNCSEYNLTLVLINGPTKTQSSCSFQVCQAGVCCCSMKMLLIHGETHNATVWKGGERFASKNISVTETIKPVTPTIVSVKESNENFEVLWRTGRKELSIPLTAEVTYHKKGDTNKTVLLTKKQEKEGLWFYEINGGKLEPRTTYAVSVRTFTEYKQFSDSSKEWEFKTGGSRSSEMLAIIVSLSVVAAVACGAIFVCYVKLKTKLWDKYSSIQPVTLSTWQPSKTPILKVEEPKPSTVFIEPPRPDDIKQGLKTVWTGSEGSGSFQSSGISTGSSHLSYAETEPLDVKAAVQNALMKDLNISPVSLMDTNPFKELNKDSVSVSSSYNPCDVRAAETSSGSSGLMNLSYSLVIPTLADPSEVPMQSETLCCPGYDLNKNSIMNSPEPQVSACLFPAQPDVSGPMQIDMSYQQCSADPQRSSDSGSFSPELESRVELAGPKKLTSIGENLPSCAVSHGFIEMEDGYQPIKSQAEEIEVLISQGTCGDHLENLKTHPEESFNQIPSGCSGLLSAGFSSDAPSGPSLLDLQRPCLPLMSVGQRPPIITDSGYQSV
ncbi:uncharacterized protein LOC133456535 [Cololabis saira]|uniref:uncharacterized protein LOC133456535 n=1 Tax=Cololabis saira TaxID=129043 RepID=UPI002AD4522C|nr:uncharacterized protein LOC133456535 [Cololabis saira]